MLNSGYASNGYFNVPVGKNYIAAYDNETESEVYKTYIRSDKNDFIRDFKQLSDKIISVFANHLEQCNYANGEFLRRKGYCIT